MNTLLCQEGEGDSDFEFEPGHILDFYLNYARLAGSPLREDRYEK